MKLFLLSLFFSNIFFQVSQSQKYISFADGRDSDSYVFEYKSQKKGNATLSFFSTKNGFASEVIFKVSYTKNKIREIERIQYRTKFSCEYTSEGNIKIGVSDKECFNKENFKKNKLYEDYFYQLLSPVFFDLSNKEKYLLLEKMVKS